MSLLKELSVAFNAFLYSFNGLSGLISICSFDNNSLLLRLLLFFTPSIYFIGNLAQ